MTLAEQYDAAINPTFANKIGQAMCKAAVAVQAEAPAIAIVSSSVANPTVVTSAVAHNLATGNRVVITDHVSTPTLNGEHTATVINATTFSVPVNVTVAGAGGTTREVVVNSTNRANFAALVLRDPDRYQPAFARAVVTNAGITGTGASDGDIEFTVNSMWNAFAGTI